MTLAERDAWRQALPGLLFAGDSLDGWMKELRLVKEPQELSCIRQAQELTDDAFYPYPRVYPAGTDGAGNRLGTGISSSLPGERRGLPLILSRCRGPIPPFLTASPPIRRESPVILSPWISARS